jgi:hypothetical protein
MVYLYLKENPIHQKGPTTVQVDVVGLTPQLARFSAGPVHEEFVVDDMALIQGFL